MRMEVAFSFLMILTIGLANIRLKERPETKPMWVFTVTLQKIYTIGKMKV